MDKENNNFVINTETRKEINVNGIKASLNFTSERKLDDVLVQIAIKGNKYLSWLIDWERGWCYNNYVHRSYLQYLEVIWLIQTIKQTL